MILNIHCPLFHIPEMGGAEGRGGMGELCELLTCRLQHLMDKSEMRFL